MIPKNPSLALKIRRKSSFRGDNPMKIRQVAAWVMSESSKKLTFWEKKVKMIFFLPNFPPVNRDTELDANVRSQIERLEKKKGKTTKKVIVQPPVEQPVEKQQQQREQAVQPQKAEKEGKERGDQAVQQQQQQKREKTVSMSSAGEEESGEYDDENVSALEQLMVGLGSIKLFKYFLPFLFSQFFLFTEISLKNILNKFL